MTMVWRTSRTGTLDDRRTSGSISVLNRPSKQTDGPRPESVACRPSLHGAFVHRLQSLSGAKVDVLRVMTVLLRVGTVVHLQTGAAAHYSADWSLDMAREAASLEVTHLVV